MSRQRKKHPEIVERRKLARQSDKLASEKGHSSANNRGRRIVRLQGINSNPYSITELKLISAFLKSVCK